MRERDERVGPHGGAAKSSNKALPDLGKLGVTKMQSSRWMEIAEIEHPVKLAYIEKAKVKKIQVTLEFLWVQGRSKVTERYFA